MLMHLVMAEYHVPFLDTVILALPSDPLENHILVFGHAAYKVKGNEMYDNIQAIILPLHAPP